MSFLFLACLLPPDTKAIKGKFGDGWQALRRAPGLVLDLGLKFSPSSFSCWPIRSDGGQRPASSRHFSSDAAKANSLLEELYPRTLGRFGGNGLFHDGSPDAQRFDNLLCAVLHPLGESPSETGRIHSVPGSGVDGAAGAKHDYGGVGKPEGLPLSAARPRCEVLPMISRTDQDGKCESASITSKKPGSELVCGTLGEVGQRRMSVEADPVWRIVAAASLAAISGTLPRGVQPSGQRQSDAVSFAAGRTRAAVPARSWRDMPGHLAALGFRSRLPHGYETVKRFVRNLRGSESPRRGDHAYRLLHHRHILKCRPGSLRIKWPAEQ